MTDQRPMSFPEWHPTGQKPDVVHLVCLGETSRTDYAFYQLTKGRPRDNEVNDELVYSETWTVNRGVRLYAADLVFCLDEIANEARIDPAYGDALKRFSGPIISTICEQPFESCYRYPARMILDCLNFSPDEDPYFHNSVPMIIAYALALGVRKLIIWGADYTHVNGALLESDRANCEFWMGFAQARGMHIGLPANTTLRNQAKTNGGQLRIYGLVNQANARQWLNEWQNEEFRNGI